MELLKKLYEIHSKSSKEDKMLEFLVEWVFKELPNAEIEMDKKCNLYITKGEAGTYPCIVAHVDQVQSTHSDDFVAVETSEIIFGWSSKNRQREGLGADDKNGVWVALKCLQKYDVLKVALFVGEEIGCVGSREADMDFFDNCRFVLQCDRRGFDDLITDASYCELCNKEFVDAIHPEWFGYKEARGMMTDVMTLKENGLKVSCVNISCGYYEPHTDDEFTIKRDLVNCLNFVENIIELCTDVYPHEYTYKPYSYNTGYGYYDENGRYKGYSYGGYKYGGNKISGFVSNGQTKTTPQQAATTQKVEETKAVNESTGIIPFFDDEKSADPNDRTFEDGYDENAIDEFNETSWVDEIEPSYMDEQMRDELYDVIFALLNDCPNASCDMIYSALKHTYPTISWDDASTVFHEVKMDMRKYMVCDF